MTFIRQFPLNEGATNHIVQLGSAANAGNLRAGNGLKMKHTSQGMEISNNILSKNDAVLFKGEFNPTSEYFPYDMIFVSATSIYTDPNTSTTLDLTPGTYVCTNYVPPAWNTTQSFFAVVASYGLTLSDDQANTYRWYQYNNYYPTPTPSTNSTSVVNGSYSLLASQSFWWPIGSAQETSGSSGWNWRGLYTPTPPYPYQNNDVVELTNGSSPGIYWNYVNNNNSYPPTGIGWSQLYANNVWQ